MTTEDLIGKAMSRNYTTVNAKSANSKTAITGMVAVRDP